MKPVLETLLVTGLAAVLALAGWLPVEAGFWGGIGCVIGGLALAAPTGLRYHVMLARTLGARGCLPPRWWWNPTKHHHHLTDDERMQVMPWFLLGAAGWTLAVTGCVLLVSAFLKML